MKKKITRKKKINNDFLDKVIRGTYNFFSSPFDKTNQNLEGEK